MLSIMGTQGFLFGYINLEKKIELSGICYSQLY